MVDAGFYLVGGLLLTFGIITVTAHNLFHAALALLGGLFSTAVLFLLLGAEMVAMVQILVYIGGVMVFVLYAIFLTTDIGGRMPAPSRTVIGGAILVAALIAGLLAAQVVLTPEVIDPSRTLAHSSTIAPLAGIGKRLLDPGADGFLIPFEVISILLLAAMVGAIAVARGLREGEEST